MAYRARLIKVLLTLALSMIAGALILAGMEPTRRAAGPSLLLRAQGQPALDSPPEAGDAWHQALVICTAPKKPNLLSMKGQPPQHAAHIRLDERGFLHLQSPYRQRLHLPDHPGTLVILFEQAPTSSRLHQSQLDTLQRLLQHLDSALRIPAGQVRLASTHPRVDLDGLRRQLDPIARAAD